MPKNNYTITIEEAELLWPNFEGREGRFNDPGQRDFNVILDPGMAEQLLADGWNVKGGGEDDEGNSVDYFLPVAVGFNKFPPRIYIVTDKGRIQLDESDVAVLDQVDIKHADMTIRGNPWGDFPRGKGGLKAWLRSMFVTIDIDPLDAKYGVWDTPKEKPQIEDHNDD